MLVWLFALGRTGRDVVDIDIERHVPVVCVPGMECKLADAGFFHRLAFRGGPRRFHRVEMATGLQPAVERPMKDQQNVVTVG